MSPAPPTIHQLISGELYLQIGNQLKGKSCRVIPAPFDVRLPEENQRQEDIENIVQPDISVVCDIKKLDDKGCMGPPDLIIEIISPSSSRNDRMEKFFLYERMGVKEYWIVSPGDRMVEVFILGTGGKYGRPEIYSESDTVILKILADIKVDLSSVFSITIDE
jgi:Uma2 family endonuclease